MNSDSIRILLVDLDDPLLRPLTRFRSPFSLRDGIFTPVERLQLSHPGAEIVYYCKDDAYESLISEMEGYIPYRTTPTGIRYNGSLPDTEVLEKEFHTIVKSSIIDPLQMLAGVRATLDNDLTLLLINSENFLTGDHYETRQDEVDIPPHLLQIIGPPERLFIHQNAMILPGSVFDTRDGVIIIDDSTEITPFSYLAGPIFIGKRCRIDNVRITGGVVLGDQVRVGGEIENCIINNYTNKHHEGFLGHSIVGSWVNLGALTTTSDLKNNYGEIRMLVPENDGSRLSSSGPIQEVPTGKIKFGSIIGDHVKVAIGTMLNTGTVLDAASNVFGGSPEKYLPPMSWGNASVPYREDKFIEDAETIMARRKEVLPDGFEKIVELMARHRRNAGVDS